MCVVIPFILDVRGVDAPVGVAQQEGHTGFLLSRFKSVVELQQVSPCQRPIIIV